MPNEVDDALDRIDGRAPAPAAAPNPIDVAIDRIAGSSETRMRRSFASSTDVTPDVAAEARKIALKTGTPADVVERNFDEYKKKSTLEQPYQAMQDHTPKLSSWLETPENAKVAKDDLPQLGFLEWVVSAWPRAISQTLNQQRYAGLRYKEVNGETLTQADHDLMESYRYNMDNDAKLGSGDSWFRGAITGTAQFLTNQAPVIKYGLVGAAEVGIPAAAAGAFTGPGALATGLSGAGYGFHAGAIYGVLKSTHQQEAAFAYDEFTKFRDELGRPLDPSVARAAAMAVGLINAPIEAGAQEFLLKSIPGINKLASVGVRDAVMVALKNPTVRAALFDAAKSYATTLTAETGQEVSQRAVSILLGELAKATNKPAEVPGQVKPGNINLYEQPKVSNPDGSVSTVDSLSVNIDGKEILLPTVTPDGQHFTGTMEEKTKQAINEYRKTGRNLGTFATPEAATAFAEQLHTDYAAGTYDQANKFRAPGSIAQDLLDEAAGALQSFALGVLPGPAMAATHGSRQARAAQTNAKMFTALGEGVAASKTMKRAPDAVQSFVEHATKGGPVETVYIPVASWSQYWQDKGIDPAAMAAEVTGSRDAFEYATRGNEDLAIPTSRYATKLAGTEHNAFLAQELRLRPKEMNAREAAVYLEEQKQQAAAPADQNPPTPEPPSIIRQQVISELQAAGATPAVAEKYATLYESAFNVLGKRSGIDPASRWDLSVNRSAVATPDMVVAQSGLQETVTPPSPSFEAMTADLTATEVAQLERRQAPVPTPPAGVTERRLEPSPGALSPEADAANQAIYARLRANAEGGQSAINLGAQSLRMISEDPTLLKRAADMRRGSDAAGRPGKTGQVDNKATAGQTTGEANVTGTEAVSTRPGQTGRAPIRRVEESTPLGRESGKQRTARRERHYADVFSAVLDAARQIDPAVNPDALHKEVQDRLELVEELDAEYADSGQSPRQLLEAIASAGGISLQAEQAAGGLSGELRWIRESKALGPFGSYGGVRGVFQKRDTRGGTGMARAGLSLDDMLTSLQQDQRFAYLENIGDLLAALEDVARLGDVGVKGAVNFPGTDELARRAGIKLNEAWWKGPEVTELFQSAFHGSPHVFEKFSLHAIGTGEGAQAYGWGLYFASKREVAEGYRDRLGNTPVPVFSALTAAENETLPEWVRRGIATPALENALEDYTKTFKERLAEEQQNLANNPLQPHLVQERILRHQATVAVLEKLARDGIDNNAAKVGRVYKVEIPEDADFLDWDRPASKQSPKVQAALRALGITWEEFKPKTIPQFFKWFDSKETTRLWKEDIGIRESLQRAFNFAEAGDVESLNRWQEQHQAYFTRTVQIDPTGELLYDLVAEKKFEYLAIRTTSGSYGKNISSPENASKALAEHGVAGIRYLDGMSRSSGEGTSNYVVFDDRLVQIQEFFQSDKPTIAPDGTYQADLFGDQLEQPLPPEEPAALQRDDVQGEFPTRTHLVTQRERKLGTAKVMAPEDAARALAYLAKGPQERFDALVTDKDGVPIGIVGSFKGAVSETPVYTSIITAEAFRINGAANIWFVHNHPSGSSKLSQEDRNIATKLDTAFAGTAITAHGIIAIGSGEEGKRQYQHYEPISGMTREGTVKKALKGGTTVPVLEREFAATDKLGTDKVNISTPERALIDTPTLAAGRFGVLMLDAQNVPIGFLPVDPENAKQLRQQGRLDWLYRALSISAPQNAILYVANAGADEARAATNLANALRSVEVHTLDVIVRRADGSHMSTSQAAGSSLSWTGQFQQEKRGVIRFGAGRQVNIELFAKADLSTFLHETGHFFLEVARDLANEVAKIPAEQRTATQQQLIADMAAVDEWTANEADATAKHEKFARGFEAYLMTGKAPSLQLRSAFARFKAWLTGIYKSLKNLNVDLSPEITAVMDRLLASDAAIADAEAQAAVTPIFLDAAQAGMTQAEFALYRKTIEAASHEAQETLQTKLLAEVEREKTAEWKARRGVIRLEVEAEMHARREYQALAAIQFGTQPDGEPLVIGSEPTPMKLSRQAIVDQFGKERLKMLPKPYVYTTDGGMEPSTAAELFGFSSADELLTALGNAGNMKRAIETETDRRMIAENGSLLLDGSLQERAQAAAANETRDQVVRAELRALINLRRLVTPHVNAATQQATRERTYERRWFEAEAKLKIAIAEGRKQAEIDELQDEVDNLKRKAAGGPALITSAIPSQAVIVQAARERIAGTRIRQIQPERFWSAARKAQETAVRAAAKQDFDAAITAQTQQLLNLALYREAEKALDDAEQRVRRAKDLSRPATRQRLGHAGHGLLEQIDGILERYEFKAISGPAEQRRAAMRKWVAALHGDNLPIELSDDILDDTRRINYAELTYDEFVGVTDGLQQIAHLAGLISRRLQEEAQQDFVATRDGMVGHIEEHGTARPAKLEILPKDRRVRIIGEWVASHTKLSQMVAALDGYVDGGPVWSAIMRPINEAATKQQAMHETAAVAMKKILTDAYTGRELAHFHDLQRIEAIGESLSKEARLAVALNWGNEGNRQRLMESGTRKWNTRQVQAILDTLDARDLRFVQASLDYINSYWPQIEAKQTRVFGVAPEKITPASWNHSRYGEQRGGYYPIAYDGRLLLRQGNIIDADQADLQQHANYAYATTKRGHTKAREEKVNAPVRLELGVMYEHVEAVIHDLTHHEMLIDVGRLMGDAKVQKAIQSRAGDIVYRQMKGALLDIALGLRHQSTSVGKALSYIKNGTTIAGLGWNVWTAAQQPLGIFNGAARIGPKWVAKGIVHIFRDANSLEFSSRWVQEKSEMMRLRGSTLTREVADLRSNIKRAGSWFDNALRTVTLNKLEAEDLTETYLFLIEKTQQMADLPVWIGGYEKAIAAGETEATAVALADQYVLDSQSGGQIKDLASVQRGDALFKTLTAFYSYGNLIFNQTARTIGQTNFRKVGSVGQMLGNLLLIYVAPAAMTVALSRAFGKSTGDDPDDFLVDMGKEVLATAMNTMVLVRELGNLAANVYAKQTGIKLPGGARGYEGPTGFRFFSSLYRFAEQATQGEIDRAFIRSAEDVAGVLFHLPVPQVQRSIDGFVALEEGRTHNPLALLTGAPPKK